MVDWLAEGAYSKVLKHAQDISILCDVKARAVLSNGTRVGTMLQQQLNQVLAIVTSGPVQARLALPIGGRRRSV